MDSKREYYWCELGGFRTAKNPVYSPEQGRMVFSKILAILEEHPFSRALVGNPHELFEARVQRVDEELLVLQASGRTSSIFLPPDNSGVDQQVLFFFFSESGNVLGKAEPYHPIKWIWLRDRVLEINYKPSPPLLEILRGLPNPEEVFYIVEIFQERHVPRSITVHKRPRGETIPEMISRLSMSHRLELAEV